MARRDCVALRVGRIQTQLGCVVLGIMSLPDMLGRMSAEDREMLGRAAREELLRRKTGLRWDIYVVRAIGADVFKIGVTRNVTDRIAGLRTACPWPLRLLAKRMGDPKMEKRLHAAFAKYRMRGEWFRICQGSEDGLAALVAGESLESIESALQGPGVMGQ